MWKLKANSVGAGLPPDEPDEQAPISQTEDPPIDTTATLVRKLAQVPHGHHLGKLQIGTLMVLLVCLAWTCWLILLTVYPNWTVNKVMSTESFDHGSFWLLVEPAPSLMLFGVVGFAVVVAGYGFIALNATWRRNQSPSDTLASTRLGSATMRIVAVSKAVKSSIDHSLSEIARSTARTAPTQRAARLVVDMTDGNSATRKFVNMGLKVVDFAVQVALLLHILETGFPVLLVYALTTVIVLDAVACVVMIFGSTRQHDGLVQNVVETMYVCMGRMLLYWTGFLTLFFVCASFAFLIAIAFPMLVVTHSLATFEFNRKQYAINLDVFPEGKFETMARVIAEPVKTSIALKSLNSLRIRSVLDFFTHVGTHLVLCYRLRSLMQMLWMTPGTRFPSLYPKRHRVGILIALLPVMLVIVVYMSISTSRQACSFHPECVVHALRWVHLKDGDKTQCPCLSLIDIDSAPKTFAEWLVPRNVTQKLAQLASTGDLESIQFINRQLTILPEELRRCTNLRHISLYYTNTDTLPHWIKDFTRLEFLHVEGKLGVSSLTELPDDMFENMSELTFLHFGIHPMMRRLPPLRGLQNLRSLTLAVMMSLEELPAFDDIEKLESITLTVVSTIDSLPDMAPLTKLNSLVVSYRGTICCNGFLDNHCDLDNPLCQENPGWHIPVAQCLPMDRTDKLPSKATLAMFTRFSDTVCQDIRTALQTEDDFATEENMLQCDGIMYRQCYLPGNRTGMCYNARMMPITCNGNVLPIEMRKRQIQAGIGELCDPKYEGWLGCKEV